MFLSCLSYSKGSSVKDLAMCMKQICVTCVGEVNKSMTQPGWLVRDFNVFYKYRGILLCGVAKGLWCWLSFSITPTLPVGVGAVRDIHRMP